MEIFKIQNITIRLIVDFYSALKCYKIYPQVWINFTNSNYLHYGYSFSVLPSTSKKHFNWSHCVEPQICHYLLSKPRPKPCNIGSPAVPSLRQIFRLFPFRAHKNTQSFWILSGQRTCFKKKLWDKLFKNHQNPIRFVFILMFSLWASQWVLTRFGLHNLSISLVQMVKQSLSWKD